MKRTAVSTLVAGWRRFDSLTLLPVRTRRQAMRLAVRNKGVRSRQKVTGLRRRLLGAIVALCAMTAMIALSAGPARAQGESVSVSASANAVQGVPMTITAQGVADGSHALSCSLIRRARPATASLSANTASQM